MITNAIIRIWDKEVGAIAWDSEKSLAYFEFEPSFLNSQWDLSPIKMPIANAAKRIYSFPELIRSNTFKGMPGLLADVLPDKYGNALINTWLINNGRAADSMNPVELLCFIGKRGMGALEFEPVMPRTNNQSTKIELAKLIEIAQVILSNKKQLQANLANEDAKALSDILKIGTSAGGARAKAVIAYNAKTKEVKTGQADAPKGFEHWLIKFDGVVDSEIGMSSGYGRVEMAYHLMAKEIGINMMESRLLEENGRAHFMTKRFDRTKDNDKIHVQSFCALNHFDFNEVNSFSYEQLFQTMRSLRLPYPDAEQLYKRMAFNVMARNCDDHTKNFSFIMNQSGDWSLAPAFDICHAYRPNSTWVSQHALSVNGKRNNISIDDLLAVAKNMNIKKPVVILNHISDTVKNWKNFAAETKLAPKLRDAIAKTLLPL
ncbi:type II toxin-antitoxin system HipA family toxin [Sediminibacterium sp.]|uniref:type II toxin-antitoxin system HipA family toxin n=1 Tax=Sediminibacterium sp. TaxID=1917865 RepID=UPI0027325D79|nr:type II toxin-antitoxin system HipA family toxin [Sediminibacterium sp.]MDP3392177.1 type II toxin-antitoxin system HipA family toxin [Sediminibacterium sp.]MDP3567021.1 type II toxin-antitoxin system HipA family toxin [Sediminibacterium sp.]